MLRVLKKIFIVAAMLIIALAGYVMIINRHSVNMNNRQKVLKAMYPAFVFFNKMTGKNRLILKHDAAVPPVSFYSLKTVLNDGTLLDMASLKGKKILLVNTASECGYTGQFDQLQKLYSQQHGKLIVIGFPANDFKEQEKGTDKDISDFCKKNYGVDFPLAQKTTVVKTSDQNNVFQWLTDPAKNGWNSKAPAWNFCKYLVNEEGMLVGYYGSAIEPDTIFN